MLDITVEHSNYVSVVRGSANLGDHTMEASVGSILLPRAQYEVFWLATASVPCGTFCARKPTPAKVEDVAGKVPFSA